MEPRLRRVVFVLLGVLAVPAVCSAVPPFARKYGYNCSMCHTAYTRLNDFGQRYRDNGYQIPGQQGGEKTVFDLAAPLGVRTTSGLSMYDSEEGTTAGFDVLGLDVLAAGVLRKDLSFLCIYKPRIDGPGTQPQQAGELEAANVVLSNVVEEAVNVRVGRFEPAYHPFSAKRALSMFAPYEVYAFETPGNSYVFADNQTGIEATGHFRNGFKYGLGVVNGSGTAPDQNTAKDMYVNLFQTFGKGDGQSAGYRLGAFGYWGWQPTDVPGDVIAPTGQTNGDESEPFYRAGVDASVNYRNVNLAALWLKGSDDRKLNAAATGKDYGYTGGFVELTWAGLVNNRVIASGMLNWVRPPSFDAERRTSAGSALVRYYLGDWSAASVAAHAEYVFRRTGKDQAVDEQQLAFLVDLGF